MIEGRYVKDGNVTEVFLPNGLTQFIVDEEKEIQAFTFAPKKVSVRKTWRSKVKNTLILASLVFPVVPVVSALFLGVSFRLCVCLFCAGWAWDGIVMYANHCKKI